MKNLQAKKSPSYKSVIRLLISPAIMASGISKIFSPENSNELCDRLELLLQEKQAGNNSNINNEELVAIADKLMEYKCKSAIQPKPSIMKCNLLHNRKRSV